MKATRLACLVGTISLLAVTSGCGGDGASNPEEAVQAVAKALGEGDDRAACELTAYDGKRAGQEDIDECVSYFEDFEESEPGEATQYRRHMRNWAEQDPVATRDAENGDVVVTYEFDDGEHHEFTATKVDGRWFVSKIGQDTSAEIG